MSPSGKKRHPQTNKGVPTPRKRRNKNLGLGQQRDVSKRTRTRERGRLVTGRGVQQAEAFEASSAKPSTRRPADVYLGLEQRAKAKANSSRRRRSLGKKQFERKDRGMSSKKTKATAKSTDLFGQQFSAVDHDIKKIPAKRTPLARRFLFPQDFELSPGPLPKVFRSPAQGSELVG